MISQTNSGSGCVNHPGVQSASVCQSCGNAICLTCEFQLPSGQMVCPVCANAPPVLPTEPPPLPAEIGQLTVEPPPIPAHLLSPPSVPPPVLRLANPIPAHSSTPYSRPVIVGAFCIQHRTVGAVENCRLCNAPMCAICDFFVAGSMHVCPQCISAPPKPISTSRKIQVVSAMILAVWTTLAMALFFGGFLRGAGLDAQTIGVLYLFFICAPALAGTIVGICSHEKWQPNPSMVWVAAIWNGTNLAIVTAQVLYFNLK